MSHCYRTLVVVGLSIVIHACGGGGSTPSDPDTTATAPATPTATITFIHLNDLHAHLTPHADYRIVNNQKEIHYVGGLARIAGMINSIHADNPNSILMNIGDTYHGGVEALYTQGNAIVEPVNALGIDIGVPGNWDFAYGPSVTRARYTGNTSMLPPGSTIARPNFPNLAANVTYSMPPAKQGEAFLPPTYIKEIAGVKIGFIGITSDIVPRMHSVLALGLDFLQAESDYIQLIETHSAALKAQGVNMVVVMSELGIHKDYKLANAIAVGAVDVFFSAHTHEASFTPLVANSGAWVMEAGNDTWLGRLDVQFSNGVIVNKHWQLLDVNTATESATVKALVDAARAPFLKSNINMTMEAPGTTLTLTEPIDTVVGHVASGMDRRHALSNTFNSAYTQMLRTYTDTQLAMTPGFRFDAVIPQDGVNYEDAAIVAGAVTVEDAYRFFPVPFTISTAQVSGSRLKQIIEGNLTAVFSPDIFKQGGGWFDGYAGIKLTVNLANADGSRITDLRYKDTNTAIADSDTITITGCSKPFDSDSATTLCSYDGFYNVTDVLKPGTSSPWSGVDFLIYGLKNNLLSVPTTTDIVDANSTPVWPQSEYVQPLAGVQ